MVKLKALERRSPWAASSLGQAAWLSVHCAPLCFLLAPCLPSQVWCTTVNCRAGQQKERLLG